VVLLWGRMAMVVIAIRPFCDLCQFELAQHKQAGGAGHDRRALLWSGLIATIATIRPPEIQAFLNWLSTNRLVAQTTTDGPRFEVA
jgi:hypothetical protein